MLLKYFLEHPVMSITAGKGPAPFGFFRMAGRVNGSPFFLVKLDFIVTLSAKQIWMNITGISVIKTRHLLNIVNTPLLIDCLPLS